MSDSSTAPLEGFLDRSLEGAYLAKARMVGLAVAGLMNLTFLLLLVIPEFLLAYYGIQDTFNDPVQDPSLSQNILIWLAFSNITVLGLTDAVDSRVISALLGAVITGLLIGAV